MTAAELTEALDVSPAAVSGAVRYLTQTYLIGKEREPGSRRDVYVVQADAWHDAMLTRDRVLAQIETSLRAGVPAVGGLETAAGRRLAAVRRVPRVPRRPARGARGGVGRRKRRAHESLAHRRLTHPAPPRPLPTVERPRVTALLHPSKGHVRPPPTRRKATCGRLAAVERPPLAGTRADGIRPR